MLRTWFEETAVRAVKTMAETALAMIGTSVLISQVDWKVVASSVALSGLCTVLLNIANFNKDNYISK